MVRTNFLSILSLFFHLHFMTAIHLEEAVSDHGRTDTSKGKVDCFFTLMLVFIF
jgi:hypothetical protein